MNTHEALLDRNGITPLLAWPTFSLEVLGGLCIILGFYSRQWAAFLLVFLGVVVWIKWPVGWIYSNTGGGWEYPMFWLLAQLAFVLIGDGAFTIRKARLSLIGGNSAVLPYSEGSDESLSQDRPPFQGRGAWRGSHPNLLRAQNFIARQYHVQPEGSHLHIYLDKIWSAVREEQAVASRYGLSAQ